MKKKMIPEDRLTAYNKKRSKTYARAIELDSKAIDLYEKNVSEMLAKGRRSYDA